MPLVARRIGSFVVTATVVLGLVTARSSPVAAADITTSAAEQTMLNALNADRAKAGLVAVRLDTRLGAIARARSTDMASKHYFGHTQPDGRTVFDIIESKGITWYGAGEIIAWNTEAGLAESAAVANAAWLASAGHKAIVLSTSYNYVGVGLAIDASNGHRIWTAVFMKGPDRTGGWVTMDPVVQPAVAAASVPSYRSVTVSWRGGDIRLVVLTAGLRSYQVQARTDGGAWVWFGAATTATSRGIRVWAGHTYDMRVRACDKAGNCGAWASVALRG
ncbi:MAG: CAP domain-containing protein [Chloroflexota bacterium]